MTNHQLLCKELRLRSASGKLKKKFKYDDVLKIAKKINGLTQSGRTYAVLRALQTCCRSAEKEFSDFLLEDPRKFNSLSQLKNRKITDIDAKKLADKVLSEIQLSKNINDLQRIVTGHPLLYKNRMKESKYPPIQYFLTGDELDGLRQSGYLDDDGKLVESISCKNMSALEKLLYAIVWKNGDIGKELHIVAGVKAGEAPNSSGLPDNGLVFHQFGKYLANRKFPIIDQHIVRAFLIARCAQTNISEIKNIREKGSLTSGDKPIISDYENWLRSEDLKDALKKSTGYAFYIDKVLFALGKAVKNKA